MATADKVVVVYWEDGAGRGDELGVIDDFDPVVAHVEQMMLVNLLNNFYTF